MVPPDDSSEDLFQPGVGVGSYRLEARIGEGGMGVVFRARREPDGAVVALKVLKQTLGDDEGLRRRFGREVRAARELSGPHLIEVLDAGEADGRAYLVMEYVAGRSLAEVLSRDGALNVSDALRTTTEIAAALDLLHANGMVHRDVKPSNILLDPERGAVLTDFGLAKRHDYSALTLPGQMLGTLQYLAPEALRGDEAGAAADLYALGCVTFECLAGAAPFAGRSVFQLGLAHLEEPPADPCAGRDDAADGLGAIVCQALRKDPAERPSSAGSYARMLRLAARAT